jgi:hypothetical protein
MRGKPHIAKWIGPTTLLGFVFGFFILMLGCGSHTRLDNSSVQLKLKRLGPFPESVKLDPIRTYAELPQELRALIGSRVSNPNGPFNAGDISIPGIPDRRMIFAYGSDDYYLVSYEKGGVAHEFVIVLFEMSGGQAVVRWAHAGQKFDSIEGFSKQIDQSPLENEATEIVW